jgi:hypothetical protein
MCKALLASAQKHVNATATLSANAGQSLHIATAGFYIHPLFPDAQHPPSGLHTASLKTTPAPHSEHNLAEMALGTLCNCFHPLEPHIMSPFTKFQMTKPSPKLSHLKSKRHKFLINISVETLLTNVLIQVHNALEQRLVETAAPVPRLRRLSRRRFRGRWQLRCRREQRWVPRHRHVRRQTAATACRETAAAAVGHACRLAGSLQQESKQ